MIQWYWLPITLVAMLIIQRLIWVVLLHKTAKALKTLKIKNGISTPYTDNAKAQHDFQEHLNTLPGDDVMVRQHISKDKGQTWNDEPMDELAADEWRKRLLQGSDAELQPDSTTMVPTGASPGGVSFIAVPMAGGALIPKPPKGFGRYTRKRSK